MQHCAAGMSPVILWVIIPLSVTSCIYAVLAAGYLFAQHRPGMALAFVGYTLANLGLIYDALTFK